MTNWKEFLGFGKTQINDMRSIGYFYFKQGLFETALTYFSALEVLEPLTAYDMQTIGALYLQMGNDFKAIEYFDQALQKDANHAPTKLNKIKALFILGKKKEAMSAALELIANQDPSIASAAKVLMLAYQ